MANFLNILFQISSLLGVDKTPAVDSWKIEQQWTAEKNFYVFKASNANITKFCEKNKVLTLPMIIHGAHELYLDDKLIAAYGDRTFVRAHSFYMEPEVNCDKLAGQKVTWIVYSYAKYFARFKSFPVIQNASLDRLFLHEVMNVVSGACLILLCFITSSIFYKKIEDKIFYSNIFASLGFAFYFIFSSLNYFPINFSMLHAHKIADVGVWIGIVAFFTILRSMFWISGFTLKLITGLSVAAILIITFSNNGDYIQLGTSLPFPFLIFSLTEAIYKSLTSTTDKFNKIVYGFMSVVFFFLAGINEILVVLGVSSSPPLLSFGVLGALSFITLIVQSKISLTYEERDALLENLESIVLSRTKELQLALHEKNIAQAELVQSAKLASLGTLSAGIAHEINNSINYVNACLIGLEKLVKPLIEANSVQALKAKKLFDTAKHGANVTIGIVASLRNYTGLNQAEMKEVDINEIIDSVTTIIRSKIGNIKIKKDITDNIYVYCSVVGMNQVFMNLITNAIDVVDKNTGEITIAAKKTSSEINISIKDNGIGISDEKIARIFDPFFTTKDVGKGTGLGLYIVKKEIEEKHKGKIYVTSAVGVGTTFHISIPINVSHLQEAA